MNAKHLFESSQSFLRGLVRNAQNSANQRHKKNSKQVSPMLFVGSWKLQHSETSRAHFLIIGPDLTINIDHRTIPAQVESLSSDSLVLLDHYGYHITISANESGPIKMFDEADGVTYYIIPATAD